jgi:hypothetical protein
MLITLIVLRLALSAVFGVAGVAKLMDQRGTREAVTDFGAPARFRVVAARLCDLSGPKSRLPWGCFFTPPGQRARCSIAARSFHQCYSHQSQSRTRPECHCFGQLYSRPLGWPTLVRNIGFAICAAFVVWQVRRAIQLSQLLLSEELGGKQYFSLVAFIAMAIVVAIVTFVQRRRRDQAANPSDRTPDLQPLPLGALAPGFQLPAFAATIPRSWSYSVPGNQCC